MSLQLLTRGSSSSRREPNDPLVNSERAQSMNQYQIPNPSRYRKKVTELEARASAHRKDGLIHSENERSLRALSPGARKSGSQTVSLGEVFDWTAEHPLPAS
jgi:hypothetical protein